ncbi:uncharacterized protein SETTUDRAFT_27947 [Exserohilum turcica Et28A]|uniref:Uncharacterized protein n=1 Tax=Exserohilum turcicum (strain 28A) TaxID=671987 RepID=R0IT55_EXST2|nr:uncharacterized protein SETTUDRAFT_27947 [Exserohilum turcica Et28A]EOA88010.1 hypothetical protein SETTUDRAFT_27947 [Exserohilum turcica Et28A]
MPPLQNPEESSEEEDEGATTEASQDMDIPTSSTQSTEKPHEDHNAGSLPTPAVTATPDPDNHMGYHQVSPATASHSSTPTPETQPSTRTSRKRKRRDSIEQSVDTNAAANRELIDSNLRHSHILLEGAARSRKPTRKSSSFFDQALYYNASISTDIAHIEDHQEPDFYGATDASYADHKATRKSSQGYIFFLFGGPID